MDTEIKAEYESEINASYTDNLTGFFNHGFFQTYLDREIVRCQRYGSVFTMALIDIDSFSIFNRRHTHIQGDRVLKDLADLLRKNLRQSDMAARYSGNLIAVVMINSDIPSTMVALDRVRKEFDDRHNGKMTISVGLASYPKDAANREGLINKAKQALLTAKARGRNKIQFFEEKDLLEDTPLILIVDDEPLNLKLLDTLLQSQGYKVALASCGEDALSLVRKVGIDLILLDIMLPEMDGYEVCRRLKQGEATRLIPVVMVTALDDTESRVKGIDAGADDFITKPPGRVELLTRVKSLIRVKMLNNSLTSIENVLFSLANMVEAKDSYTQGHIERVSGLAVTLGRRMGLSKKQLNNLRLGGILHDIGKLGVPENILNKPGPLNPEEWKIMKEHCVIGYNISLPLKKNLGQAIKAIRGHHEKLDGSGYPDGQKGDEICIESRIMAVVDIYDSLITDRPYRNRMQKNNAFEILQKEAEEGKLDKKVVSHLIELECNQDRL